MASTQPTAYDRYGFGHCKCKQNRTQLAHIIYVNINMPYATALTGNRRLLAPQATHNFNTAPFWVQFGVQPRMSGLGPIDIQVIELSRRFTVLDES
jgi:hypothetical protein